MVNTDYSFPYPVIGISDDIEGEFESEVRLSSDEKNIRIEIKDLILNNNYLKKLFIDDIIKAKLIVYCPSNLSTKVYDIYKGKNISIPEIHLINSVTISTILVANEVIKNYSDSSFHKDYSRTKFNIDKGNILGVSGENTIMIPKSDEKLTLGSIFTFTPLEDDRQPISFQFDQDQITIMAPKYKNLLPFKYIGEHFMWTAMNIYVLPALTRALSLSEKFQKKYKHYRWFQVLETILPFNEREEDKHYENAQELLMRADKNSRLPSINNLLELRNE